MGGTSVAAPPAPPTIQETMAGYTQALPGYFKTMQEWAPQMAQLEQQIAQGLYPETAALQEQLAGQARAGMEEGLPEWARKEYMATRGALGGYNVPSPSWQEGTTLGLLGLQKNWQDYYRNLGLTMTGRLPLTQTPQVAGQFTPGQALGYAAGTYGPYVGAMTETNIARATPSPWYNIIGKIGGGLAGGIGYGWTQQ